MKSQTALRILAIMFGLALLAAISRDCAASESEWEISVGQTYRPIEGKFTGGINFAITKQKNWLASNWRTSLGVITGQLLHDTHNIDHLIGPKGTGISSTGFGFDTLGIQRHVHLHLDVKSYTYLTVQYVKYFREGKKIQPYLAFGPSIHDKIYPLMNGYLSWASSLGVRFHDRLGIEFRHNSNSGLWSPNWGQNVLSLTWRL